MSQIISILEQYQGTGILLILYVIALVVLFLREQDRANRIVFLYLPLTVIALFLFPPFHALYVRIEGSDTYYRFLWLVPMAVTIGYCTVRQFTDRLAVGAALVCAAVILTGDYVYDNENIVMAENRLHIPQVVVDVCDYINGQTGGSRTMAAMPPEFVQFVRQYDSRILMPYGREMLMPQWSQYYHSVYDAMTAEPIDGEQLVAAVREYNCNYFVMSSVKMAGVDLEGSGIEYLATVDGYNIYRDPLESAELSD